MVLNNCLKVSYKGLTRNIVCDANVCYDDIITKVMKTFDLLENYRKAVEIYDEQGSKFDKEILEYFVLLFPNPQKLFFIRLDASKCWNMSTPKIEPKRGLTISKTANIMKNENNNNSNVNSDAVPVRRQNCFLGQWPSGDNANIFQSHLQASERPLQRFDFVKGIKDKINLLQQHHRRTKNISTPTVIKRSMRL